MVEAARTVFLRDGYTNAKMSDIAEEARVSPGLSYRYFRSKLDLLDAVSDLITNDYASRTFAGINLGEKTASQKLDAFFEKVQQYIQEFPLIAVLHKKSNTPLYDRVVQKTLTVAAPLFERLIEEGNADGSFSCPYPFHAARLLIGGLGSLGNEQSKTFTENVITSDLHIIRHMFAQMLGEKNNT